MDKKNVQNPKAKILLTDEKFYYDVEIYGKELNENIKK